MIQFYLLSVLLNLLAGFYMFFSAHDAIYDEISPIDSDEDNSSSKPDFSDKGGNLFSRIVGISENSDDKLFRIVVGGLSFLIAMIKLFSPVRGIVIIGDFLPAVAGLAAAANILLGYYMNSVSSPVNLPPLIRKVLVDGQKFVGIFCIAAAVLHFLFPYSAVL